MKLKRLVYLVYYVRELDRAKLRRFTDYAIKETGLSFWSLWLDIISSSLRYNISILDYFYFRFYHLDSRERSTYAGTGFMYEYQLRMNPKRSREVLQNKIAFLSTYKPFVRRAFASLPELEGNDKVIQEFLGNKTGKLVCKGSRGQVGAEVKVVECDKFNTAGLLAFMRSNGFDLLEGFVVQHHELMRLSPSGLNTVRVFTQVDKGKLTYLGARLRVTINSTVDNMAAGNIAAPVDLTTGRVTGPGVYSDITKQEVNIHPITGEPITGFQVPYWEQVLMMMEHVVFVDPQNASVGWDVAITEDGPELIEGNHNWCKLLWQLPVKKGMKAELERFA
jgi:hypothetical protein